MNKTYRLIWNRRLGAWVAAAETTRASGKKSSGRARAGVAAAGFAAALGASLPLAAADLAPGALPTGGSVAAGQAAIAASGTRMDITQSSQKAIINWQGFDIGSQAQVNFAQPNASAVALNRVSGPNISRIEGQLTANGQVFLVNPSGVIFGNGARVNAGAFVASTLNIRDDDFLAGNYAFTGTGGAIENRGTISAAPGGYVAFIAPKITNAGTVSAPQGTVAMGAGERVTLNFAGDRLVGLSVAAETLDTLIENRQAIRAEGGAILLTAAGAEAVTRGVINNTGVLEASSLTADGGRIVLTAGNDINLGAASTVAVDGQKGGEIKVQAQSGTLLADGQLTARGTGEKGGTVKLLGHQAGLVNAALIDASGTTGGGTVLVGGDYQGKNTDVQNASRTYVSADATIKADALDRGDGGKVVVWADEITRYYGSISAKGGSQGGNGGFVEVSGKRDLEFLGAVDVAAPMGTGGRVLLDPQDIVLNTTTQPAPPNNPNGTPDVAFADPPAAGTTTIRITDITGFSELYLQATNNITVGARIIMGANNSIRLEANNNITLVNGATAATRGSIATSGTGSITLKADADGSGSGNLVMNNATLTSNVGGIAISGASISGSGAITATGAASANGGNIGITGTSATGNINLTGAITTSGGTAAAGTPGRNAGNVTITGAGAVTTGAITANGSNGNGANQAGGNGGVISITSNGTLTTGNLGASGGNGVATAAGGNAGSITVTNNSTAAGTLTAGTLTARAGAAAGAIVSGAAGSVNVTNKAATLLQTGAIDTRGQVGGAGGNVALTSAGGVTVSSITTIGSTLNAGTAAAGRNAGNVTIKGVNRSIAGAINASGGAAIVAGQAGGAAGNVQITGTDGTVATAGTLSTTGITARSGSAVGTVASGTAGSITLEATQITATGALDTRGGNNGAGGNVVLTSTGTLNINGAIATSGGTANASSAGRNAGNVTISGAGVTSTAAGTITASGSGGTTAGSNQPGGAGGVIQVSSNNGVALGAAVAASGGAATTINANGGNAGSIVINNSGSGNISTTTLTASTGAATGSGTGGSAGFVAVTNTAAGGNLTTAGITTTGGAKGNGGNVTLSALGAVSTNPTTSNITTSGGAGIGSVGGSAGNVTISGGGVNLGTGTVTANGGTGNGANQAGGNGGNVSVTGTANTVVVGAISTIGGNGGTGNANGGNAGAITLDGGGATPSITLGGNITATGGNRAGTGTAGAGGNITVADTLNIGAANRTISSRGGSAGVGAGGNITLGGPIYDSGTRTLSVTGGSGTVSVAGGAANTTLANNLDTLVVTASDGAGKIRVGSVNTIAAQSYDAGTGGIELNGIVATLGSAGADIVTFSDPVTLTGNSSITTAGGGGDNIAINQTINGAFGLTLNAGAAGNVSTGAAIGGSTPLASFSAAGAAVTFGQAVTAGSIFARSTTGNMTLNPGTILTGTGTGNAIELVAGGAASRFINNAGAGALNASNGAGRFLIWSQNPANDTRGGLAYAFKQYNATYGVTPVADATANNDGFLYVLAPTITPGLAGTVTKIYDGTATATLAAGNFTATGAVDGDSVSLSGTGTYDNRNVGTAKMVTATGIAASASNGAATVFGYQVNPTSVSANIGTITAAPLTVTAQTDSRVYNGSTSSAVAPVLTGATYDTVGTAATQTYDNKNVGTGKTLTASGLLMNDGNGGNNYAVTYVADTTGVITAAPLTVTAQTDSRVYNGTTSSAVAPVVTGTIYGPDAVGTAATQTYDNRNVGTGKTLTASGLAMNDGNGGNNYAVTYVADTTGVITAAPLTVTAQTDSRVYNGGTGSAVAPVLTGATYDAVGTAATQAYDNRNVGTGKTLTASGLVMNDGNGGNNYAISYVDNLTGQITPAALTLNAASDNKVYDGTTSSSALVTPGNLQTGDSFTASQSFLSKNVLGTNGSTLAVNAGYVVNDGNGGANYTVTTTTAQGTITPASLVGSVTARDKVYDSTTAATITSRSLSGVIGSDNVTYTGGTASFADKNAGIAKTVTATGLGLAGTDAGNYTVNSTATTTASITPAPLTITANDASRPVNSPNPQFTASYAGFVGGETPAVLNGALSFSTPATQTSPVGIYPITPNGQSSGNYAIAYVDGKLTIQGIPVVTLPVFPREAVNQQAIAAQYTDPTMSTESLVGPYYVFDDDRDGKDRMPPASAVRIVGSGIRLPN